MWISSWISKQSIARRRLISRVMRSLHKLVNSFKQHPLIWRMLVNYWCLISRFQWTNQIVDDVTLHDHYWCACRSLCRLDFRHFLSSRCSVDIKTIILTQIILIFTREFLHLAFISKGDRFWNLEMAYWLNWLKLDGNLNRLRRAPISFHDSKFRLYWFLDLDVSLDTVMPRSVMDGTHLSCCP